MKVQVFPDWFVDLIPWIFEKGRIPTNTNEMKSYLKNKWKNKVKKSTSVWKIHDLLRSFHLDLCLYVSLHSLLSGAKWLIFPNLSNPNPGVIYAHLSVLAFAWLIIAPKQKTEERWKEDFHLRSTFEVSIEKGILWKNYPTTPTSPPLQFFSDKKRFAPVSGRWTFHFCGELFSSQGKLSACFPLSDLLDVGKSSTESCAKVSTNPRVGRYPSSQKKRSTKKDRSLTKRMSMIWFVGSTSLLTFTFQQLRCGGKLKDGYVVWSFGP